MRIGGSREQRRNRRFAFNRHVQYCRGTTRNSNGWSSARALDLSFGGIRILADEAMDKNTVLQFRLDPDSAAAGLITRARVVYVRADAAGGQWLYGCEFLTASAADHKQAV